MKKYKIQLEDKEVLVEATTHKLILKNGEKVSVIVHRPYGLTEKFWCVSDRITGTQICGWNEYFGFLKFCDYFRGLDTKEHALWTALAKMNISICDRGKTYVDCVKKLQGGETK